MKRRKASIAGILLLCVLIISMATYVMKWVFERYTTVIRYHRSTNAKIRTEGVFYNRVSCCGGGKGCLSSPDGKVVSVSINCTSSTPSPATFTLDEDI